jgi:hypothetical protein
MHLTTNLGIHIEYPSFHSLALAESLPPSEFPRDPHKLVEVAFFFFLGLGPRPGLSTRKRLPPNHVVLNSFLVLAG